MSYRYNEHLQIRIVITIICVSVFFLCYTLIHIAENIHVNTKPPPFHASESKFDPRSLRETMCVSLCRQGMYHHHHLKQTQLNCNHD
jgi:hypothetical protein